MKHFRSSWNRKRRGAALITTASLVFILFSLGTALLVTMQRGLHLARHVEETTLAFNVAESGADRAARWLKEQSYPPAGTATIRPFGTSPQALGAGSYRVDVIPDPGNAGAILKAYKIVSTGTIYGKTDVIEMVLREQSFGRYAYFTDRETSAISGGRIWFFQGDRIRGPAHSNNDGGSNFQIDWQGSTAPIFEDMVTAVGTRFDYNPRSPSAESEYLKIFKDGSRGYRLDVDRIPLPDSSNRQRDAAWGGTSSFPTTNGIYVPANGGIYVRGDASVTASVDGSGRQVFTILRSGTSTATTVTIDLVANTRLVRVGSGSTTTVAGAGTGVLYSTGHITSLSGTIADNRTSGTPLTITHRNAYTIATDVNAGKNITITNDIAYASAPDPSQPVTADVNQRPGTLGLIGRNVTIDTGTTRNLDIDAIILAGSESTSDGSFGVEDYNTKNPTGTINLMGGVIQKARGAVGTISGGVLQTGYAKDYWYDPRLADYPPPHFPTTGLYDILSWRKIRS